MTGHLPIDDPRSAYNMKPKAIAICKDYWSHAKDERAAARNNPQGFMVLMRQMQIDLILCHLDDMSREDATRAQRTIKALELML